MELAADILVLGELLNEARIEAISAWREEEGATSTITILQIPGSDVDTSATRRLIVLTKSFYVFVRAYQDALYSVLFELITKGPPGDTRMQRAIERPENPVGRILREGAPQYVAWFPEWRSKRNAVKEGVGFSTVGPTDDIGVAFNKVTSSGRVVVNLHESNVIRLHHLVAALALSAEASDLASLIASERATSELPGSGPPCSNQ